MCYNRKALHEKGKFYMELVAVYLYNRIPMQIDSISNQTFHNLKRNGWYTDNRTNQKFTMLNKRIEIDGQWYRLLIRFENVGNSVEGLQMFKLSLPVPFIATQCEPVEGLTSARWKDTKTFHGPKLGTVTEMMRAGLPSQLIDQAYADLQEYVIYL